MGYQREVYANAPVAYVVCEIRYPLAPAITNDESLERLTEDLTEALPLPSDELVASVHEVAVGGSPDRLLRFASLDRTLSVSVTRTALSVETTAYDQWPAFRAHIVRAIEVVADRSRIAGAERVGLRYIDEIRVPSDTRGADRWTGWVNDGLLGQLHLVPNMTTESFVTEVSFVGEAGNMTVRCASLDGTGVISDAPLRRPERHEAGPFFVIDADSFRNTPSPDLLDFDPDALGKVADELHDPLGVVFQNVITERSRALFRGE